MQGAVILLLIIVVPLLWLLLTYNRLVGLRNHCHEAWSNIDTELKRRYDLIPNLVAAVKGYAAHEKDLFEEVTRLRSLCAANNGTPTQQAETEHHLVAALRHLLMRVEAYPDLKASEHFLELQQELTNTEDRLQAARRFYNGNVRENNIAVESFPANLIAASLGMHKQEFFEVDNATERHVPRLET